MVNEDRFIGFIFGVIVMLSYWSIFYYFDKTGVPDYDLVLHQNMDRYECKLETKER